MKKNFKTYALIWAIVLAVFNAIVFLVRPISPGYVFKYDAKFWIAWAFVIAAFIGNLGCAYVTFKAENVKKLFYKIPLVTAAYSGLTAMLVCGVTLMKIPYCPTWLASLACIIVFALNAIAIIIANRTGNVVYEIDEKIKTQTAFIKSITVEAQNVCDSAKSDVVRAECKKVYEALRYSDPMSCKELSFEESQITDKMAELAAAVYKDDVKSVSEIADEIILLAKKRNNKCKALK